MRTPFDTYVVNRYGPKLTAEQYKSLKLIINAFPETALIDTEGNFNDDMIDLLALLAKMSGASRELILGMSYAHSVEELKYKIIKLAQDENLMDSIELYGYKTLLAKFFLSNTVDDPSILYMTKDGIINHILPTGWRLDRYYFFANEPIRKRYKGSKVGVSLAIRDYVSYDTGISDKNVGVNIEINDNYFIFHLMAGNTEDHSTTFNNYIDLVRPPYLAGSNLYYIKKDSDFYKFVLKYVPSSTVIDMVAKRLV